MRGENRFINKCWNWFNFIGLLKCASRLQQLDLNYEIKLTRIFQLEWPKLNWANRALKDMHDFVVGINRSTSNKYKMETIDLQPMCVIMCDQHSRTKKSSLNITSKTLNERQNGWRKSLWAIKKQPDSFVWCINAMRWVKSTLQMWSAQSNDCILRIIKRNRLPVTISCVDIYTVVMLLFISAFFLLLAQHKSKI